MIFFHPTDHTHVLIYTHNSIVLYMRHILFEILVLGKTLCYDYKGGTNYIFIKKASAWVIWALCMYMLKLHIFKRRP